MTYRIEGLDPARFAPLFTATDAEHAAASAMQVRSEADRGFPCRVSLEDAPRGATLLLVHYVSHDVPGPFRSGFAIYVRESAQRARFRDEVPPMLHSRTLSLRGFDVQGMLASATLVPPGEGDATIRRMLADPAIATLHAHNAAAGCFVAEIVRD